MATTTIRIDTDTHARLVSLIDTVRDAVEALRRQRFARRVTAEIAELRSDPEAWASYLADAETTSVTDGVG